MVDKTPKKSNYRFFTPVSIHWGDMDALGHVNHAMYFRYVETARIGYMANLMTEGESLAHQPVFILANISCQYIRQLKYPGQVELGTRIRKVGGKSIVFECAIFEAGNDSPAAISEAVLVWFDYATQKTESVPDRVKNDVLAYEVVRPEGL